MLARGLLVVGEIEWSVCEEVAEAEAEERVFAFLEPKIEVIF